MADHFFSLEEAENLLPSLQKLLDAAITSKKAVDSADEQLNEARSRILVAGGMIPNYRELAGHRSRREEALAALQSSLQQITSTGCLVKDLDTGLIDFPCLVDENEVYLCWKLGEERIGFWHRVEDGFAGRQPLDEDFLRKVRRERPN
jgi:hypothetical protein